MRDNNPFLKPKSSTTDLSGLDAIKIPGETKPDSPAQSKKTYDTTFTARITKDTHNKIMFIKNHADPDIKRSLGIIIEQAVDLYVADKELKL